MAAAFANRIEAGKLLASKLKSYASCPDTIVLGIPRGGVPVAFEISQALHLPLDIFVVRKLGVPGQEELAMGAIAAGGGYLLNHHLVQELNIPKQEIGMVLRKEQDELERREHLYRQGRPPVSVRGKTVLLIDDGLATGSSMQAAIQALRTQHPASVVIAVPVAPRETVEALKAWADKVVCLWTPAPFDAIGRWYRDFSPTSDDDVRDCLNKSPNVRAGHLKRERQLEGRFVS